VHRLIAAACHVLHTCTPCTLSPPSHPPPPPPPHPAPPPHTLCPPPAGHALYEQGRNLGLDWEGLPVNSALSMGIHESQSLFWERMVGVRGGGGRSPQQSGVQHSSCHVNHRGITVLSPAACIKPRHAAFPVVYSPMWQSLCVCVLLAAMMAVYAVHHTPALCCLCAAALSVCRAHLTAHALLLLPLLLLWCVVPLPD
jgi:hypothetical protein